MFAKRIILSWLHVSELILWVNFSQITMVYFWEKDIIQPPCQFKQTITQWLNFLHFKTTQRSSREGKSPSFPDREEKMRIGGKTSEKRRRTTKTWKRGRRNPIDGNTKKEKRRSETATVRVEEQNKLDKTELKKNEHKSEQNLKSKFFLCVLDDQGGLYFIFYFRYVSFFSRYYVAHPS